MYQFVYDCADLFNELYAALSGLAYFRFFLDFAAILISFAVLRAFWWKSRRL